MQKKNPKEKKTMTRIKVIYAFTLVLAVGTALIAKYATEKSLGNVGGSLESEYLFTVGEGTSTRDSGKLTPDESVQNPVFDVPDTREAVSAPAESETADSKFAVPYKSYYCLPLGTKIQKDFSPDTPVYYPSMGDWRVHTGVDFAGSEGAAIVAIAYGTVTDIYEDALLGTVVTVDHGNEVVAKYCGLLKDSVAVKKGETVKAETTLGYLSAVPCENKEAAHLHFEVLYRSEAVDPIALMGKE